MRTFLITLVCCLITFAQVRAEEPYRTDTVRFEAKQLIAPAALITVGALGVSCKPFKQARLGINDAIGVHKCAPVDDILQYAPMAAYLGVEYLGAPCRKPIVDRVIVGATSTIIMTALVRSIKPMVNETRPNGGSHSFPSGHSATAFMGAELLRQDYGPAAGAIGYATASLVGFMRILNNRHWTNDVLAGAGIGILSAYAGEWLLPFNRRWLGLDRRRTLVVLPTYAPATREVAISVAMTL